jgi:hypothetical protein
VGYAGASKRKAETNSESSRPGSSTNFCDSLQESGDFAPIPLEEVYSRPKDHLDQKDTYFSIKISFLKLYWAVEINTQGTKCTYLLHIFFTYFGFLLGIKNINKTKIIRKNRCRKIYLSFILCVQQSNLFSDFSYFLVQHYWSN